MTTITASAADARSAAVAEEIRQARERGRRYTSVACTLHADGTPSLCIDLMSGRAKCRANCLGGSWHPLGRFYPNLPGGTFADRPPAAAVPRLLPDSSAADLALQRVLSSITDREDLLRQVGGRTRITGEAAEWLASRALDPARCLPWLYEASDAVARVLRHRWPRNVLAHAGLVGPQGRLIVGGRRRLLLVYRELRGSSTVPVWAQAVWTGDRSDMRGPKYRSPTGTSRRVFGLDTIAGKPVVVLTEGVIDALSVLHFAKIPEIGVSGADAGVVGFAGVSGGITAPRLRSIVETAAPHAHVVVAFDADPAGDQAAADALRILKMLKVPASRWRPEGNDLNDDLRALRLESGA